VSNGIKAMREAEEESRLSIIEHRLKRNTRLAATCAGTKI
jgi:hypothetical protein